MAVETPPAQSDQDLASIAEARTLARAARQAQARLAGLSPDQIGALVAALPSGVVAPVVPPPTPTSTAIYKVLIALKARCAIVISPPPAAVRCITRTVE